MDVLVDRYSLCMLFYTYYNAEVEFMVNIPWKAVHSDSGETKAIDNGLEYLRNNFGLDPMMCVDSWVEWE